MYNHTNIEEKWLQIWEENKLFQGSDTHLSPEEEAEKEFLLFAFAYPSGSGLHVGHVESKTALDILARFHRMNGKKVFFPVGWDAFGLPAENYAIKTGVHPMQTTKSAINTFRGQIKRIGVSYDWENEIATSHPEYYRWTQWIFAQLYTHGLAYQENGMVNWCSSCQTVLANEQVVGGLCERCDTQVVQKQMRQWYYKITEYQDELISGLDTVDWPAPTKAQQLHWIGKKEGALVRFALVDIDIEIVCFTTRVDTIFGVSFLVISPEKFLELKLEEYVSAAKQLEVSEYIEAAFSKTEEDRQKEAKHKTGVDTGLTVVNPVTQEKVPVFVAEYVLAGFGTGAVMGVPAHDERDAQFAQKYALPSIVVIDVLEGQSSEDPGVLINSGKYSGMNSAAAKKQIITDYQDSIEENTNYRLRDWLISRQRYWGTPIPIIYDPAGGAHLVADSDLPWELPTDVDFKPTGESPLKSSQEFLLRAERYAATHFQEIIAQNNWAADGKGWKPEFDTMDTFVDSSWYFLRYVDSRNKEKLANSSKIKQWLPVDLYMIGPEHIVLHLLYARFFTKFLRDRGLLDFDEPFVKMRHQGMILGPDGKKMSKSKGNVINPDDIITKFGADTLRVYEMFMGPLDADKPWDIRAVIGVYKFLQKLHKLFVQSDLSEATGDQLVILEQKLHQVIRQTTEQIPGLKFNTVIASLMELVNLWQGIAIEHKQTLSSKDKNILARIIAPFIPFLAEELYIISGSESGAGSSAYTGVHYAAWPSFDADKAQAELVTIPVQISGKIRGQLLVPAADIEKQDALIAEALQLPELAKYLEGKKVLKTIYIPGKIISLVIN